MISNLLKKKEKKGEYICVFMDVSQLSCYGAKAISMQSVLLKHISGLDAKAQPKAASALNSTAARAQARASTLISIRRGISGGSCCKEILLNSWFWPLLSCSTVLGKLS